MCQASCSLEGLRVLPLGWSVFHVSKQRLGLVVTEPKHCLATLFQVALKGNSKEVSKLKMSRLSKSKITKQAKNNNTLMSLLFAWSRSLLVGGLANQKKATHVLDTIPRFGSHLFEANKTKQTSVQAEKHTSNHGSKQRKLTKRE